MVDFVVASDVHLEFGPRWYKKKFPDWSQLGKGRNLILAGDIGRFDNPKHYKKFLSYLTEQSEIFEYVFIVLGNHECYGISYQKAKDNLEKICHETGDNVIPLISGTYEFTDFRIIGTTMWAHIPDNVENHMNDYKNIKREDSNTKISTVQTNLWHQQEVNWISEQLLKTRNNGKKALVITHHAPILLNNHDDIGYRSDLSNILERNSDIISVWVHGHTHQSFDQIVFGVRIVCNPLGYLSYKEETGFIQNKIITIQ